MKRNLSKLDSLLAQAAEEECWFVEHGGTLAAYVARYGSKDGPTCYGNGGEAIFKADVDELAAKHGRVAAQRLRSAGVRNQQQIAAAAASAIASTLHNIALGFFAPERWKVQPNGR